MQTLEKNFLHVRFAGRSQDLALDTLGLWPSASDAEIKQALARFYDCSKAVMDDYVVQREPHTIIVRPIAIYG